MLKEFPFPIQHIQSDRGTEFVSYMSSKVALRGSTSSFANPASPACASGNCIGLVVHFVECGKGPNGMTKDDISNGLVRLKPLGGTRFRLPSESRPGTGHRRGDDQNIFGSWGHPGGAQSNPGRAVQQQLHARSHIRPSVRSRGSGSSRDRRGTRVHHRCFEEGIIAQRARGPGCRSGSVTQAWLILASGHQSGKIADVTQKLGAVKISKGPSVVLLLSDWTTNCKGISATAVRAKPSYLFLDLRPI